jgi:hypothetical protein
MYSVTTMIERVFCCTFADIKAAYIDRPCHSFRNDPPRSPHYTFPTRFFFTNCSETCLRGMIILQFLWYFSQLRNATNFRTWDGSLWARRGLFLTHRFLSSATRKWISIRLRTMMNHINEELYTKYVAATSPRVCGSACYFLFYLSLFIDLFLPWVRWLVAGLLQRRLRFGPKAIHVEYVMDKVSLGQVLSPSTSGFPRHYYSTIASSSCSLTMNVLKYQQGTNWRNKTVICSCLEPG